MYIASEIIIQVVPYGATKNEKIFWALIRSKVFVFRFSEGPSHEVHGNTKTKNEKHGWKLFF